LTGTTHGSNVTIPSIAFGPTGMEPEASSDEWKKPAGGAQPEVTRVPSASRKRRRRPGFLIRKPGAETSVYAVCCF